MSLAEIKDAGSMTAGAWPFEAAAILNALPLPVILVGPENRITSANMAAESFFAASSDLLRRSALNQILAADSPLFSLVDQVREDQSPVREYGVTLDSPRMQARTVDIQVAPVQEQHGTVLILLQERSIAEKMDRQLTHRGAARSVSAMAAMLAHEVKNPLSGIRGAAQLLEQNAVDEDKNLTRLICDETDRICKIMDRMDIFAEGAPSQREAVNIHEVLDHVSRIAEAGFGSHLRILRLFDPSLPPVAGNRDQLIQLFLNLIKNAAEAAPRNTGEIQVTSAFRPGVRLSMPGASQKTSLPLEILIQDNGPGVPSDIVPHLFDPFVTSKINGSGLGLAIVAKIVNEHRGIVEYDTMNSRTVFRVLLPMMQDEKT